MDRAWNIAPGKLQDTSWEGVRSRNDVLTKEQFESAMKKFKEYYSSREKYVHASYQESKRPERNKRKAERRKSRARVKI